MTADVAALLRGINVGGRRKLPMAALREALVDAGFEDVATYVQSGNVVLRRPPRTTPTALERRLEEVIRTTFTHDVAVLCRTAEDLASVMDRNPLAGTEVEPRKLHVVFLAEDPAGAADKLDRDRSLGDRYWVAGSEIFVHYPDGMGRSTLTGAYFERTLGIAAIARNWTTVVRLHDMLGAG